MAVDVAVQSVPEQADIQLPNGITLTGIGGDVEQLREQFEDRHEALTGEPVDATTTAAEPAETPPAEAVAATTDKPKPIRKRISQLTFEREEAMRRAEVAEAKAKELEAKLTAAATPAPEPVPVAPVAPREEPRLKLATPEAEPTRVKPTEDMVGTKYTTYADFVEDLADWKAEQREAKLLSTFDARTTERIEADRASRTRVDFVKDTVFPRGRAAYADFDAVLKATEKLVPYAVQDAILRLPNPEHAIYALAKNDSQVDSLVSIMADPVALGIAVAQLIPREPVAPPASTAPAVRTTNAPAPPQPVGAGTRTAKPTLQELADKGDWDGYKAARAAGQIE